MQIAWHEWTHIWKNTAYYRRKESSNSIYILSEGGLAAKAVIRTFVFVGMLMHDVKKNKTEA